MEIASVNVSVMDYWGNRLVQKRKLYLQVLSLIFLLTEMETKSRDSVERTPNGGGDRPAVKDNYSGYSFPNITLDCGDRVMVYKTVARCHRDLQKLAVSGYPWFGTPSNFGKEKPGNYQYIRNRNGAVVGDSLDPLDHACDVLASSQRCLHENGVQDACLLVGDVGSLGLQVTFDFLCNHKDRDEELVQSLWCLHSNRVFSMLPFHIGQRCGLDILDEMVTRQDNAIYYIMNVSTTENLMHSMLHLYCLPWNLTKRCVNTIVRDQCGSMGAVLVRDFILHFQNATRSMWNSIGVHTDICDFDILRRSYRKQVSPSVQRKFHINGSPFYRLLEEAASGTALDTTYGKRILEILRRETAVGLCNSTINSFLAYSACVLSSEDLLEKAKFNILQFAHQMPLFPYHGAHCDRLEQFTTCWNMLQGTCGPNVRGFALHSVLMVYDCNLQTVMDTAGCEWQDILLKYYVHAGSETLWPLVVQGWDNPAFLDAGNYSISDMGQELEKVIAILRPGAEEISRKCGQGRLLQTSLQEIQRTQYDALRFYHIWEDRIHMKLPLNLISPHQTERSP